MRIMAWMTPALLLGSMGMLPRTACAKTQSPTQVEGKCNDKGGVYFPPTKGHSYGCLNPDGSGIVCGGAKKGCDSWPATPGTIRPKRAQELGMPEKVTAK